MAYDCNWLNDEVSGILEDLGFTLHRRGGGHSIRATESQLRCLLPVRDTKLELELSFEIDSKLGYKYGACSVESVLEEDSIWDFTEIATAISSLKWRDALADLVYSLGKKNCAIGQVRAFRFGSSRQQIEIRFRSNTTGGQYLLTLGVPTALLKRAATSMTSDVSRAHAKKGWVSNPYSFSDCGRIGKAVLYGDSGAYLTLSCTCDSGSNSALAEEGRETVSSNALVPFPDLKAVLYVATDALLTEGLRSPESLKARLNRHGLKTWTYKALSDHALEIVLFRECRATKSTHSFKIIARVNESARVALSNDMRRLDLKAKRQVIDSKVKMALERVDAMSGDEFEDFCAENFRKLGYTGVEVTRRSNDGGSDVLATSQDLVRYAVQCKRHKDPVGRAAVQAAVAGKIYYGCHVGIVVSSGSFTKPTEAYAKKVGVVLWNRSKLVDLITAAAAAESTSQMLDEDTVST